MKPQSALLLATGAAVTGTILLARRRLPPLPEPQLGPTILVVAEERSTFAANMPTQTVIDAALQPVDLAGGTWIGLGPRITRATHLTEIVGTVGTTRVYVTMIAQPVTWPAGLPVSGLDNRATRVVEAVTAALRRPRGGLINAWNPNWTFVGAVPFDPGAHGRPSFWVSGQARETQTQHAVVENLREDPVGARDAAAVRSLSQQCCGYATAAVLLYGGYKMTTGIAGLMTGTTTPYRAMAHEFVRRAAQPVRLAPREERSFRDGNADFTLIVQPRPDDLPVLERLFDRGGGPASWRGLTERGRARLETVYQIGRGVRAS